MQQQRKRNCALRDHWRSRKSRGRSSRAPVGITRGWRKARRFTFLWQPDIRPWGQHPRYVHQPVGSHRPRLRRLSRPLQLRVRHLHVVPARRRHRRPPQGPPPRLEPRRYQVRHHDNRTSAGQHEEADEQLVIPPCDAVRLQHRPHPAQPLRRPGPHVRRQRHRLPQLPLRPGLQLLRDRHVHGRRRPAPAAALCVPRAGIVAGGPQLPVRRGAAPVAHRCGGYCHEEGEERWRWRGHVGCEGRRAARHCGGGTMLRSPLRAVSIGH